MKIEVPYLYDQLIPYIGNKRKLLPLIMDAISETGCERGVFFDAFSGSGVVSRLAKHLGFSVVSNDWEPYSEAVNNVYIAQQGYPDFSGFGGVDAAIARLNGLPGLSGYISKHYCPADDEDYDTTSERMFYTQENGRRIDAMREQIEKWHESGSISSTEKSFLLAPLVFQSAYCSNTSGVFKGFHNGWGGQTKTAWYRIRSLLTLKKPRLFDNGLVNRVYRADAKSLASEIDCDIAYLDPPYNQHQYGANYHMLNTVVLWDKPPVSPRISVDGKKDKAAIRKDWRTERRSAYCYAASARDEFCRLIGSLRARYILVSYSTDGIIGLYDILETLAEVGSLSAVTRKYKRYRVSSQRPSSRAHTTEFVIVCDTSSRSTGNGLDELFDNITGQNLCNDIPVDNSPAPVGIANN